MSKHSHRDSNGGHDHPHVGSGTHEETEHVRELGPADMVGGGEEVEKLRAELAAKEKDLAELNDKYLRTLAEGENARKRIRTQAEESQRIQRENLLRELLPVVDNLERAIEHSREGDDSKSIVQGVEMVLKSLLDFLRAQGVTPLTAVGQPFDPARHEAVDHITTETHPANTVVDEFHRGYQIGERILRPARVSVAKGSSADSRSNGEAPASDVEKS
ncbi:MAG TPA: nucleotide exchange factor GrpE [Candidatus Binataceae bacterium]|nr:nucleotide exchange factor GrpE [Candidatus Binataceae bacterium]